MDLTITERTTETTPPAETAPLPLSDEVRVLELRYRRLFEEARDGIFLLDIDTLRITDANPFMTQLLGYTRIELIGREPWELGVFSDRGASKEAFHIVQTEGYLRYDDLPLKTTGGRLRGVEVASSGYAAGHVRVIQCNIRDIAHRKRLEENQAATEERFRSLFEYAPDGILIASSESHYLEANASVCRMLGYSREELIGLHAEDIVIPSEVKHIEEARDEIQSDTDHHRVWQFRRKDGSDFPGEVLVTEMPDGNLLAMIRDISGRQKAESEKAALISQIENHRTRLDNIVANVPGIVWETAGTPDRDWEAQDFVSAYVLKMLGYTVEEWLAIPNLWRSIVHPDDRERAAKHAEAAFVDGQYVIDEFRWLAKDGRVIWVEVRSTPIFDDEGVAVGVRGVTIDITQRKRAQDELERQQTELRVLFDLMPAMIWFKDTENNILRVNRRAAEAAGLSVEEIEGRTSLEIYPDEAATFFEDDQEVINSREAKLGFVEMISAPHGRKVWVQTDKVPYFDADGKPIGIVVMRKDVTDRTNAEEALVASEERYRSVVETAPDVI